MDELKECLRKNQYKYVFQVETPPKPRLHKGIFDEGHSETAVLVLSDMHLGKVIDPDESNGLNKYNTPIAANRLYAVIEKFKRILRGHQAMYNIEKIWVPILGDMMNGSIHPDMVLTNDLMDIPATVLAARLLIIAILELRTLGIPIEIDCVVGNHPRLLAKMTARKQAHLSYDWIIYQMIAQYFEKDPSITVRVHKGQFGVVELMGHRIVVEHGHMADVKTLQERVRNMFDNAMYRNATGLKGESVSLVVIGDKHRDQMVHGAIVNASLCGGDEYGVFLRLEPVPAVQQMFGISKKKPVTFHYGLDVTDVVSEAPDNHMSKYAIDFMRENQ